MRREIEKNCLVLFETSSKESGLNNAARTTKKHISGEEVKKINQKLEVIKTELQNEEKRKREAKEEIRKKLYQKVRDQMIRMHGIFNYFINGFWYYSISSLVGTIDICSSSNYPWKIKCPPLYVISSPTNKPRFENLK